MQADPATSQCTGRTSDPRQSTGTLQALLHTQSKRISTCALTAAFHPRQPTLAKAATLDAQLPSAQPPGLTGSRDAPGDLPGTGRIKRWQSGHLPERPWTCPGRGSNRGLPPSWPHPRASLCVRPRPSIGNRAPGRGHRRSDRRPESPPIRRGPPDMIRSRQCLGRQHRLDVASGPGTAAGCGPNTAWTGPERSRTPERARKDRALRETTVQRPYCSRA